MSILDWLPHFMSQLDLSQQETGFTARISLVGDGGWQHQA